MLNNWLDKTIQKYGFENWRTIWVAKIVDRFDWIDYIIDGIKYGTEDD